MNGWLHWRLVSYLVLDIVPATYHGYIRFLRVRKPWGDVNAYLQSET